MTIQIFTLLSSLAILVICLIEIRRLQIYSKTFAVWGIASLGFIGSSSALATAGFQIPAEFTAIVFALSGAFLSISVFSNRKKFPHSTDSNYISPRIIFLLLVFLTVIGLFNDSWRFPVLMMAGYLPLILLSSRTFSLSDLKVAVFTGTALMSLTIFALALFSTSSFFGECRFDKCSIWGSSIGSFSSGNALALQISALGILLLVFAPKADSKIIVAVTSGFLVDAAAGRTSLVAHLGTIMLLVIVRYVTSTRKSKNAMVLLTLLVSFGFALFTFNPQDFTFRGELWIYAKESIADNLFFGHGASEWVRNAYSSGIFLNYSTHNIWLEALYVSGIFGFAVLVFALTSSRNLWGNDLSHPQIGLFFWIILSGLTEVPTFFARPYIVPNVLLIYLLATIAANNQVKDKTPTSVNELLVSR